MEKPILENELNVEIVAKGDIKENINDIKEYAMNLKDYYSQLIFTEEQIDIAKSERATLNKMQKEVADYRKNIVAEFKKPIDLFATTAKQTEKILKETSEYMGSQITKFENIGKEKRNELAKKIYEENIEELKDVVSYEKIFNDKWLNKGAWKGEKSKVVLDDIEHIKEIVRAGLQAIEELNSEFELEVKNTFLKDFNLSSAILKNSELLAQKEKLNKTKEKKEQIKENKIQNILQADAKTEEIDPLKTYILKITGPLSKQKKLKEFLDLNNMKYEKCETIE